MIGVVQLGSTLDGAPVKVLVIDSHAIYRRGLVASLSLLDSVASVTEASAVRDASVHEALPDADVVIIDTSMPGGRDMVASVAAATDAHVIVCAAGSDDDSVLGAVEAGATSYLRKDLLTQDLLSATIKAVQSGAAVVAPAQLGMMLRGHAMEPSPASGARLTKREQRVLALIAEGCPTREVAVELSYSERTVKNILHDVVTKLNARSRSQAVAHAVRDGLI